MDQATKSKKVELRTLSLDEWRAEAVSRFGEDAKKWVFVCASCGEKQTIADFISAGIESPETKAFFSCIGRYVEGRGCDWTLGGLLKIHHTEVINENGDPIPVFEFAEVT